MSDRRKHPRGIALTKIGVDGRPTRFCRRLIFEFFNTIGQKRTSTRQISMSALPDMEQTSPMSVHAQSAISTRLIRSPHRRWPAATAALRNPSALAVLRLIAKERTCSLLYRKVCRIGSFEELADIHCHVPISAPEARSVRDKAARVHMLAEWIKCRTSRCLFPFSQAGPPVHENGIAKNQYCIGRLALQHRKRITE